MAAGEWSETFYRAFEDRFRGSRETIRSRLNAYLPFIAPFRYLEHRPAAVDLGCGRGEWLELLREHGYDAQGVDLDDGMLAACRERELRVTDEDAIAFLQKLPNESQAVVSAFHVAEHLSFSQLRILVEQAWRVLKPAGLLILETPNPENLKVSMLQFHLDPTHKHLLPPELLLFLAQYNGFDRSKVIRLNERGDLLDPGRKVSMEDVLSGASPDYALVAQKCTDSSVAQLFDDAFNREFGLAGHVIVDRFDEQLAEQRHRIHAEQTARVHLEGQIALLKGQIALLEEQIAWHAAALAQITAAPLRSALRITTRQLERRVRPYVHSVRKLARAAPAVGRRQTALKSHLPSTQQRAGRHAERNKVESSIAESTPEKSL